MTVAQKKSKSRPFLWIFSESAPNEEGAIGYYDEKMDLNMVNVEGKSVPVVVANPSVRRTQTKTMVKRERDDTD